MILVFAAGFGISTAIFGTVRSVLFTPLPYNKPERLVQIVTSTQRTVFSASNCSRVPQRIAGSLQGTVYRTNERGGRLVP